MADWFRLSLAGCRRGAVFMLALFALSGLPGSIHAQEIVLPALATTTASAVAPTATATTKYAQCATDADCVLLDDACKSLTVVNQLYIADANAGMAHEAACRPAATASPVGIKATCRNGLCGLLPGRIP
jgi:hypothetical protein